MSSLKIKKLLGLFWKNEKGEDILHYSREEDHKDIEEWERILELTNKKAGGLNWGTYSIWEIDTDGNKIKQVK
jgi:hypothetical protein